MGIKKVIRKIAEGIFQSSWYPNKKIILESNPDLSSQTLPVYKYMLAKDMNQDYKIIWLVKDKKKYKDIKIHNVYFLNYDTNNIFEKIARFYLLCTSRAIVYSHKYIGKIFQKQILFYLRHGSFIKSRLNHCQKEFMNECDACVCMSHYFDMIEEKQMMIPHERFVYTGYPTDDYILENKDYSKTFFTEENFDKVIMWLPTFRKMVNSDRLDSSFNFPIGVPCLYSSEECIKLNDTLNKHNILLLLKPHPAQDISILKNINLSNIRLLSDNDIQKAGIELYQYLGSTDALITDYSSVYYDYLLTDKIIGLTIDDIDVYAAESGFAVDYFNVIVGEYMKCCDDMINFVEKVAKGEDTLADKRKAVKNMIFDHCDASNTERVYDVLVSFLRERYGSL